jgi:hypothetical protein
LSLQNFNSYILLGTQIQFILSIFSLSLFLFVQSILIFWTVFAFLLLFLVDFIVLLTITRIRRLFRSSLSQFKNSSYWKYIISCTLKLEDFTSKPRYSSHSQKIETNNDKKRLKYVHISFLSFSFERMINIFEMIWFPFVMRQTLAELSALLFLSIFCLLGSRFPFHCGYCREECFSPHLFDVCSLLSLSWSKYFSKT